MSEECLEKVSEPCRSENDVVPQLWVVGEPQNGPNLVHVARDLLDEVLHAEPFGDVIHVVIPAHQRHLQAVAKSLY